MTHNERMPCTCGRRECRCRPTALASVPALSDQAYTAGALPTSEASPRWIVTRATNFASISMQCGVPVSQLMGIDPRTEVGEVEAATKGAAIIAAHLKWPRIPVEELGVQPAGAPHPAEKP